MAVMAKNIGLKTNFVVLFRQALAVCFLGYSASVLALPFGSRHVLVVEESTGTVLLRKDADSEVPIASLTKLMTAMVVLLQGNCCPGYRGAAVHQFAA